MLNKIKRRLLLRKMNKLNKNWETLLKENESTDWKRITDIEQQLTTIYKNLRQLDKKITKGDGMKK